MRRNPIYTNTRCIEGRTMRHDPQHDDPDLETDIGQCEECEGRGCDVIAAEQDAKETTDRPGDDDFDAIEW
jgi:hypothetical protein